MAASVHNTGRLLLYFFSLLNQGMAHIARKLELTVNGSSSMQKVDLSRMLSLSS
uniref:Uncharacterized protein n=1 Tax=Phakopsora pachyrhizi TaxID=170000 RepID=A0A0S1MJU6_PHAPC